MLFTAHGVSVYGGGSSHKVDIDAADIVLDLHDKYRVWAMPPTWSSAALANVPVIVSMYIPDMSAPYWIGKKFWKALWSDLMAEAKSRGGKVKVLATCFGGHGRTGTVLTALALAAGVIPKKADPITWVRDHYCDHAIETTSQIVYLESLFGFKTVESGYKAYVAASASKSATVSTPASSAVTIGASPSKEIIDMYDVLAGGL